MKKRISIYTVCLLFFFNSFSQTEIGAEYQHGFGKNYHLNSFGALYEGFSNTGKSSWQIGLSYTFDSKIAENKSSGRNGIAISLGYRYGFSYGSSGNLVTGIRAGFNFGKDVEQKNHSVFTPSVELGYHYTFNNFGKGMYTTPSIAFGYNISMTQGKEKEDDYEGTLIIPRVGIGYRF